MELLFALVSYLPDDVLVLLAVLAGICIMVPPLRRLGWGVLAMVLAMLLLPLVLGPVLAGLPSWGLWLVQVFLWLATAGFVLRLVLGKRAVDHMKGALAADCFRFLVTTPFRFCGGLLRLLFPANTQKKIPGRGKRGRSGPWPE